MLFQIWNFASLIRKFHLILADIKDLEITTLTEAVVLIIQACTALVIALRDKRKIKFSDLFSITHQVQAGIKKISLVYFYHTQVSHVLLWVLEFIFLAWLTNLVNYSRDIVIMWSYLFEALFQKIHSIKLGDIPQNLHGQSLCRASPFRFINSTMTKGTKEQQISRVLSSMLQLQLILLKIGI